MNPHCTCPVAGYCNRHQMRKGPELHKRCKGIGSSRDAGLAIWNAWEQGRNGATAPVEPILNPPGFERQSGIPKPVKTVSDIGAKLEAIIERERGRKIECAECRERVLALNQLSKADVLSGIDAIAEDIESRINKVGNTLEKTLVAVDRFVGLGLTHRVVKDWITEAVETAEEMPPKKAKAAPRPANAAGAARFLGSLKKEQDRLFELNQRAAKPEPDPFIGEPVLHFGAHLYPVRGNWEWHVDLWNQQARLINGRCFIGIGTDNTTDSVDDVRKRLHPRFEVFTFQNTGEGENHTFRWLQKFVPTGRDDVLIYAHSKGVRPHTAKSEAVRRWSEAMYQTVVFNHDGIVQRLAEGYRNFHSFRTFGTRPLSPINKWHPSGTFFAVRAKCLRNRTVKPRYGGVEAWCGDHFAASES